MNDLGIITDRLVETGKWSEEAVRIGARSRFKCAYCDRDMLASVDDYKAWQEDHIVPTSKGGADTEDNKVLSCRTCNVNIKGRWDPRDVCGANSSREERIKVVREYVEEKRTEQLREVSQVRDIVFGASR